MVQVDEHEVYPNAPLQLVAVELRYPLSPRLGTQDQLAEFHAELEDVLPVAEIAGEQSFVVSVGGSPPIAAPPMRSLFKLGSRDRTAIATVSGTSTTIETTSYRNFATFLPLVRRVFDALGSSGLIVGLERVGLRYIDEVRVRHLEHGLDAWAPYIHDALIDQVQVGIDAAELTPSSWQGTVNYLNGDDKHVVLRYGALDGFAVNPDGPLRLARVSPPGPFFLLDIDSYWSASEVTNGLDVEWLADLTASLHRPVRRLFEAAISDKLRDEVLRKVVAE